MLLYLQSYFFVFFIYLKYFILLCKIGKLKNTTHAAMLEKGTWLRLSKGKKEVLWL